MEALSQVCDPHLLEKIEVKSPPTSGSDIPGLLRTVSPKMGEFLLFCRFRGKLEECSHFFKEILTDEGVCYTFNMLPDSELFNGVDAEDDNSTSPIWKSWFTSEQDEKFSVFPHRALSGFDYGLNIVLNMNNSDLDYICKGPVQGFRLKVHPPNEFPKMSEGYQRIPLQSETLVAVKPTVTFTKGSDQCHSTSSNPLQHFKQYSYHNCMNECESQFVHSKCGCVKFWMVHNDETKICNQRQVTCVTDALTEFSTTYTFENPFSCDCKPTCDNLEYNTKVSYADFEFAKVFTAYGADLEEFPDASMSRLTVVIDKNYYSPTVIGSLNDSSVDFIAKLGGILAFFLGVSWISIIEIIFYLFKRVTR